MKYNLEKHVMENPDLRQSYNKLAERTFGLNFEKWYQDGYGKSHIPYTLFEQGKAVSNVSVNLMKVLWQEKVHHYIQLGTVMTDSKYRKQGLSRMLLEEVLHDWKEKVDGIFLFANDSVLDFYPKFGFKRMEQYQYQRKMQYNEQKKKQVAVKLDVDKKEDLALLRKCYEKGNPFSKLQVIQGFDLLMFYCGSFLKDCIYYVKEQEAVVIAEQEDNTLYLLDVFCEKNKDLQEILTAITTEKINEIVFKFTPIKYHDCEVARVEDDNDALFVLEGKENIFAEENLMFPEIAHT